MHMDELKSQKIWFCWNYETRKGKRTKVPISAYGTPTGTNAPYAGTWVTYDEAVKAAKKHGYNGVGFKIPEGYFFLDIDHKDLSDPYVQQLLERFDSYAEFSVSGGGVHIYGKCDISKIPTYIDQKGKLRLDKAFYMKKPNNETELYFGGITNRFAVYTGNVIRDEPLKECTEALLTTLDKNMRKKQKQKYSAKRDGGDKEVFDIVRKYTDVRELTPEIIREFVDRIEIFKPERISGHKVQRMRIVWNCIGEFMPPQPKNNEKSA